MTKIDQIQNQILEKMAETLSNEQTAEVGECNGNRIPRNRGPGRVHTACNKRAAMAKDPEHIPGQ